MPTRTLSLVNLCVALALSMSPQSYAQPRTVEISGVGVRVKLPDGRDLFGLVREEAKNRGEGVFLVDYVGSSAALKVLCAGGQTDLAVSKKPLSEAEAAKCDAEQASIPGPTETLYIYWRKDTDRLPKIRKFIELTTEFVGGAK